jgi:predicted MPP superfamily phosphohydrolase
LGRTAMRRRIEKQAGVWAKEIHQGEGIFVMERFVSIDALADCFLRATRLRKRAHSEFLHPQVVEREVWIDGMPEVWDGYRILHLSDLHLDADPEFPRHLTELVRHLRFDQCVLTGDYHDRIEEDVSQSLEAMQLLLEVLGPAPLGVLGNHDLIEQVAFLEHHGLRLLLNESLLLKRGGHCLAVVGVDDPHFFRSHDLRRALAGVPEKIPRILLAHSSELYEEAAQAGIDLYLCGHTHGGQLCLPGGRAVIHNARAPRRMLAGAWQHRGMQAYTSRGAGACGLSARLFCPGEITIHTLRSPHCGSAAGC